MRENEIEREIEPEREFPFSDALSYEPKGTEMLGREIQRWFPFVT